MSKFFKLPKYVTLTFDLLLKIFDVSFVALRPSHVLMVSSPNHTFSWASLT